MNGERELLQRLAAGPISGDALARDAGLTRAAVWKRIQALREAGLRIDAQAGRGYTLAAALDLLDADVIRAGLTDAARSELASIEVAWSLDSTNSELLRRETPARAIAVLLAEQQTGGRGRRGRVWSSPLAANLYVSVARQFSGGLARLGGLSLVAGIAVTEALRELGVDEAGLKWPNDVVVGDRKLGGVLIEGGGEHGGPVRAVIGMGLNVRMPLAFAQKIDQPWIDLAALRCPVSRNEVASAMLSRLLPALRQFDADGLAPFRPRYAALDVLANRAITVHAIQGDCEGVAEGIAEDGSLRVRIAGRIEHVYAGEVSVRAQ